MYDGVLEYHVVLSEKSQREEEHSEEEIHRKLSKAPSLAGSFNRKPQAYVNNHICASSHCAHVSLHVYGMFATGHPCEKYMIGSDPSSREKEAIFNTKLSREAGSDPVVDSGSFSGIAAMQARAVADAGAASSSKQDLATASQEMQAIFKVG